MPRNPLLELLQAASNSAASNVSGPIDLVAAGMRKLGIPVNDPMLGSEWMRRQGLTREVQNPYINAAGETLGMVGPLAVAAKAPQIAAGVNQAVRNAQVPMSPGLAQRGAIVYHGSPHKFDKFDSSKIGTGEGAQAYGHGLYLAESQAVAKDYAEKLSSAGLARHTIAQNAGQTDAAIAAAEQSVKNYQALIANGGGGDMRRANGMLALAQKKLADLQAIKAGTLDEAGQLYKADLSDNAISRMLDWDKPLSQQAPEVQRALSGLINDPQVVLAARKEAFAKFDAGQITKEQLNAALSSNGANVGADELGQALYMRLGNQQKAAEALRSKGIQGVKYLDGFSRGPQGGSGTRNYVVFPGEENAIIKMLERNGKPIP